VAKSPPADEVCHAIEFFRWLLGKPSGNNVPQPGTGAPISSDYIVHVPTQTGHDVLSGRDDGTTAVVPFTWGPGPEDLAGAIASGARSIVLPVMPMDGGSLPADPPEHPPTDDRPDVPPDVSPRVAQLEAEVTGLHALLDEVLRQITTLNRQAAKIDTRVFQLETTPAVPVTPPAPPPSRPSWWPF